MYIERTLNKDGKGVGYKQIIYHNRETNQPTTPLLLIAARLSTRDRFICANFVKSRYLKGNESVPYRTVFTKISLSVARLYPDILYTYVYVYYTYIQLMLFKMYTKLSKTVNMIYYMDLVFVYTNLHLHFITTNLASSMHFGPFLRKLFRKLCSNNGCSME